jgi:hypothetical protein
MLTIVRVLLLAAAILHCSVLVSRLLEPAPV